MDLADLDSYLFFALGIVFAIRVGLLLETVYRNAVLARSRALRLLGARPASLPEEDVHSLGEIAPKVGGALLWHRTEALEVISWFEIRRYSRGGALLIPWVGYKSKISIQPETTLKREFERRGSWIVFKFGDVHASDSPQSVHRDLCRLLQEVIDNELTVQSGLPAVLEPSELRHTALLRKLEEAKVSFAQRRKGAGYYLGLFGLGLLVTVTLLIFNVFLVGLHHAAYQRGMVVVIYWSCLIAIVWFGGELMNRRYSRKHELTD